MPAEPSVLHLGIIPRHVPCTGCQSYASVPSNPVVVVEGEKCVDAAKAVFPFSVVVTSPGGSNGVLQADWTPLAGRTRVSSGRISIFPGQSMRPLLPTSLVTLGVPEISIVDAERLAEINLEGRKRETIPGWDVSDAIEEGRAQKSSGLTRLQPHSLTIQGHALFPLAALRCRLRASL